MSQKLAEGLQGGIPPFKEGQKIDLKIAHWCLYGPRVSGMYETVRELIQAENKIEGVLAGMCETPNANAPTPTVQKAAMGGKADTMFPDMRTQDWGWAMKWADIHVIHSTMANKVGELKPKAFYHHGCFHQNQLLRTADGSMKKLKTLKRGELMPSKNFLTGEIEPKPITDVGPNGEYEDWYRIKLSDGPDLTCTNDHPFYLKGGSKIFAENLKPGMILESAEIGFTNLQKEIILGANIGDAYIDPNALCFSHKDRDYNDVIINFFKGFNVWRGDYPTGYGSEVERVNINLGRNQILRSGIGPSYHRSPFRRLYTQIYNAANKKELTKEWLEGLSWVSLAVLYYDDGSHNSYLTKKGNSYQCVLNTCGLTAEDAEKLSQHLKSNFGIENTMSNVDYPRIYIGVDAAPRFLDEITNVFPVPESMSHKIPAEYLDKKTVTEDFFQWMEDEIEVISVKKLDLKSERWAITVADNHNYLAGGCLVSNTPEACLANDLETNTVSFMSAAEWTNRFEATFVTSKRAEEVWGSFDHSGEKVHLISKGIDLDWWIRSPTSQDLEGEPSILYGEIWRGIKHPLHLFYACKRIFEENPKMRLNVWGLNIKRDFWQQFLDWTGYHDFIGKRGLKGIVDYPNHWYTRGDVLISPGLFGDVSRVQQEAMACGCPSISWDSDPYGDAHSYKYAKAFDTEDLAFKIMEVYDEVLNDRLEVAKRCRNLAERYYNINNTAKQIVGVLRTITNQT